MTRVTAIYATPTAMPPIQRELAAYPDLDVLTLLDEALLRCASEDGGVLPRGRARMENHLRLAADAGSEGVLVTCNIYSAVVPELREELADLEVLAIDEPMVEIATSRFRRTAVIATGRTGLETQISLLRQGARDRSREVELVPVLCEEAFTALAAGDGARHDELVLEAIASVEGEDIDAVVLAQASMARVLPLISSGALPVLSSPRLAVEDLHRRVAAREVSSC